MWRHFFAAISAAILLSFLIHMATAQRAYEKPLTPEEQAGKIMPEHEKSPIGDAIRMIVFVSLGLGSGCFFFADAVRREYRDGKTVAIALTSVGLFTFGVISLAYYAIWGWRPRIPAAEIYGRGELCQRCLTMTTDRAAPSVTTYNAIYGMRWIGSADRCPQCRSVDRTLWVWFGLPIFPLGTYRLISTQRNWYVGRRTFLRWSQVLPVYAIALVVAAVMLLTAVR